MGLTWRWCGFDAIKLTLGYSLELRQYAGERRAHAPHTIELLGHAEYSYPAKRANAILAAMNAEQARVADLARLNFLLGELYADAVLTTQQRFRLKAELVGCHGQTLYHQGEPQHFLGRQNRRDLADRRGRSDHGARRCAGGFRFSSSGYCGGRQGSAAGSLSRLSCCFATRGSAASCRILAASRISLRLLPAQVPTA